MSDEYMGDTDTETDGTYRAECVCGWSLERGMRASNLPAKNNERITRKVADVHENRPRFGDRADETHVTTFTGTERGDSDD